MATRPVSLRIPDGDRQNIEEISRRTGRDFSSVANEMLAEAVKMRRIPGIIFADSPSGRVARIAGTGIEVYEVVRSYWGLDRDWDELRNAYHWLTELQLRAALAYAEAYPKEIDKRIEADERWTPEEVWLKYPFTRPRKP